MIGFFCMPDGAGAGILPLLLEVALAGQRTLHPLAYCCGWKPILLGRAFPMVPDPGLPSDPGLLLDPEPPLDPGPPSNSEPLLDPGLPSRSELPLHL